MASSFFQLDVSVCVSRVLHLLAVSMFRALSLGMPMLAVPTAPSLCKDRVLSLASLHRSVSSCLTCQPQQTLLSINRFKFSIIFVQAGHGTIGQWQVASACLHVLAAAKVKLPNVPATADTIFDRRTDCKVRRF